MYFGGIAHETRKQNNRKILSMMDFHTGQISKNDSGGISESIRKGIQEGILGTQSFVILV